jgi:TRAP-type mannitol/chloroaromatic compound transport system permease small subunit
MFLLASSYTLGRNEHVRIDVVAGRFSKRTQVWIDVFGFALFLLPISVIILYYSFPYAQMSVMDQEMSTNPGGLFVWPTKVLIPAGFLLLTLQGVSELIKRIGYLMGMVDAREFDKHAPSPEEEIEAIKAANKLN